MSKLFYDSDLDYLEIFFKRSPNYGEDLNRNITIFKSESKGEIIGYGIYRPGKTILSFSELQIKDKIGVLCFLHRRKMALTEKEFAAKIGINYRTYQRIEEGKISKIDDLIKIMKILKERDLSKIIKAS